MNITSWGHTFENFKAVKDAVTSYEAFKELSTGEAPWYMVLNYGSTGCGKTHLCEAYSIALAKRNIRCKVWEWPELIREFKRRLRSNIPGDYDRYFDGIRKCQHLILDDVVMAVDSKWEWGEFEDIINYRYRNNLVTIVTTNLDITKLPPRSVSRFRDKVTSRMVLNKAEDFRPLKVKGGK
ncbi:MAG: ATP-binding protein [Deltaproteobacteria bacterium]|nr:ATP-binding protein [Deltaproteobacteria bacterium]